MPNILQYPISTFGILKAGLIVENINPLYTARELETQLINSKSETIIILENFAHLIEKIIHKTVVKNIIITSAGELLGIKGFLINFVLRKIKKMVPEYKIDKFYTFSKIIEKNLSKEINESAKIRIKKMLKKYTHKDVVEFISKKENLPKKMIYNYCLKLKK